MAQGFQIVADSTATLIDNIFTSHHGGSGEYLSGILPTDISDHFSIFHIISTGRLFHKIEETFSHRIINDTTTRQLGRPRSPAYRFRN